MARKGWDQLSGKYRDRLVRKGVTEHDYSSGAPLHGGRGHGTASKEAFMRRSAAFARDEVKSKTSRRGFNPLPERTAGTIRAHVRGMGRVKGEAYMAKVKKMTRLYERGDTEEARRMWEQRDTSQPDYLYFYHGIFGY